MIDITREALGGMGFTQIKEIASYPAYILNNKSLCIWVCLEKITSNKTTLEEGVYVSCGNQVRRKGFSALPHIRTLPQLRQLVRSLFGDEALPRRELSSITDEELLWWLEFHFQEHGKESGDVKIRRKENKIIMEIENIEPTKMSLMLRTDTGVFGGWKNNAGFLTDTRRTDPVMINELDIHLPAFHGVRDG